MKRTKWKRYVYVRDVQGNIRAVVGENNAVAEQTDYYPYGMPMADVNSASAQPFKFGGKELEREGGTDFYDFEARRLDFALGRFTSPDPLCEQTPEISPYAYCVADPVNFIDPTGMFITMPKGTTDAEASIVQYNIQKLTDDKIVWSRQEDNSVRFKIIKLEPKGNLIKGTNLIRNLNSSKYELSIVLTDGDNAIDMPNFIPGEIGADVTLKFNPNFDPDIKTMDENGNIQDEPRPAFIGLAHEMVHAYRAMFGAFINYKDTVKYIFKLSGGGEDSSIKPREELETVGIDGYDHGKFTENGIRKEHNLNKRIKY